MKELRRLLGLFRPYWGWLALGVLLSFLTLMANVGLMATSGWFIAAMAVAGAAGVSMNYFTPAAIIRACAIVRTVGRYGERLATHEATLRLLSQLRVWFYQHLEPLAPARLQQCRSGDLLSRIRADIDTLGEFYLKILAPVSVALLTSLLLLLFLFRYDPLLALIEALFLLLAGLVTPWFVTRMTREPGRRLVDRSAELRASVVDGLQGMAELTVYGGLERHADLVGDISRSLVVDQARISHYTGISQGSVGLCANLALWLVLVSAIPAVTAGSLPAPFLAMLALFTLASFEAVIPLPQAFMALNGVVVAAQRIFAMMDAKPQVAEPLAPSPDPLEHSFQLQQVWFRYQATAPWVLRELDLALEPGRKLAVVGPTGSGKSSLVSLLLRFWAPERGEILFGGHPLAAYRGDDLRRHVAVVSQHTHLFNTTIRENLLLANPEADQARLEQACRVAQIDSFIRSQREGYDTPVGEAALRLSGGQARRVAIARAILKDAPILILDEPAEGLDAPAERALMVAIHRLMVGRSVLLVTHRLIGLEAMDEILVLDRGRVLERGSHQALLAAGGYYRQLCSEFRNT